MLSFKMQHQEFEPPEALRDTIKCFWYNQGDFGEAISGFKVLPDGYAEIIFHFGSGCSISHHGGLQLLPSPFMMGLLNQPVLFYTKNRLEIIGIRCFPWTVFDLLGLPSGKNSVHIFEHPIAQLQPTLNKWVEAGRIDEAMAQVKQYFLHARSQVTIDRGILLDFDNNTSLKTLAGEYGDRMRYISGNAKDRLAVSAVLIRPDGMIAWVSNNDPDYSELQKAATRWFVCNAQIRH